ncbi:MAG: hypothetical protein EOO40_00710 [Deltaproteobacteria bacterium]|nr:MAG: hypothetical protein EOO40_00710 [Deltaproteobacteria bacterium]
MALELKTGKAQSITPEDFNERVKRVLADKPEPRKAEPRGKNYKGSTPFAKSRRSVFSRRSYRLGSHIIMALPSS